MSLEVPEVSPIRQEPSSKAPAMEKALDDIGEKLFGRTRTGAISQQICVCCGQLATTFRDDKSAHEYTLSGMCQACQDKIFDTSEE
jgi:hypothetical protein